MKKTIIILLFLLALPTLNQATAPTINSCTIDSNTTTKYVYQNNILINTTTTGTVTDQRYSLKNIHDTNFVLSSQNNIIKIFSDNFNDGDYTNNPAWTVVTGTVDINSNRLQLKAPNSVIKTDIIDQNFNDINVMFKVLDRLDGNNSNTDFFINRSEFATAYVIRVNIVESGNDSIQVLANGVTSIYLYWLTDFMVPETEYTINADRNIAGGWTIRLNGTTLFPNGGITYNQDYNTITHIKIESPTAAGYTLVDDINLFVKSDLNWSSNGTYPLQKTDTLDYFQYACEACNNGECTRTILQDWNGTIDQNITFNITNEGSTPPNYLATFYDENNNIHSTSTSLTSEVLSNYISRTNRTETYSIRIDDQSNPQLFGTTTFSKLFSEDTNTYNLAITQPDVNIVFANSTTVSGKILYSQISPNGTAYQDFTNVASILYDQNSIPTGLTKIVFNGNTGTNDFNQVYQYYNNTDYNSIDENIWTISGLITGFAQINVTDKTGAPIKDATIRSYQEADTNKYRLTNQIITGTNGTGTIWANSFGILRIEVKAEGYYDQNTYIENKIFVGTGSTIDISLKPTNETIFTYNITANPVNKKIQELGTITRVNITIQKEITSCIQTTINNDNNIIETYTTTNKQYQKTQTITYADVNYNQLIYIDTDEDQNCYNNYVGKYTWYYDQNQLHITWPDLTAQPDSTQREANIFISIGLLLTSGLMGIFFRKGIQTLFIGSIILSISGVNALFIPAIIGAIYLARESINRMLRRR